MLSLNYIYYLILIIGCIIGWIRINQITTSFKVLTVLLLLTIITEALAYYFAINFRNNSIVFAIYTPFQFYLLCAMYYLQLRSVALIKYFIVLSVIAFSLFSIYKFITADMSYRFPVSLILLENVLLYILVLSSFMHLVYNSEIGSIYSLGFFWVNLGFIFFLTSTFLIWGLHNYLIEKESVYLLFRILLPLSNIFLYSSICVGIIKEIRNRKT